MSLLVKLRRLIAQHYDLAWNQATGLFLLAAGAVASAALCEIEFGPLRSDSYLRAFLSLGAMLLSV